MSIQCSSLSSPGEFSPAASLALPLPGPVASLFRFVCNVSYVRRHNGLSLTHHHTHIDTHIHIHTHTHTRTVLHPLSVPALRSASRLALFSLFLGWSAANASLQGITLGMPGLRHMANDQQMTWHILFAKLITISIIL